VPACCLAGVSSFLHPLDQEKLPCQDFLSLVCLSVLGTRGLSIPTEGGRRGGGQEQTHDSCKKEVVATKDINLRAHGQPSPSWDKGV
jgi:hypothetical protein